MFSTNQENGEASQFKSVAKQTLCCESLKPYKFKVTDYDLLFKYFLYTQYGIGSSCPAPAGDILFGIQVISQINFRDDTRQAEYFTIEQEKIKPCDSAEFKENFVRLNSFKNFTCKNHNRFFEINGYKKGLAASAHHISQVTGHAFPRDTSLDGPNPQQNKGTHWKLN